MTRKLLAVGDEPAPLRTSPVPSKGKPAGKRSKHSSGRFGAINAFVDATLRDLSRAEIAVWLILWRDTKPEGTVRTSQVDIARRAGLNPRNVKRAVRRLIDRGLLAIVFQGGFRRGVSVYRVHPTTRA